MDLRVEELSDNLTRVTPVGRWDVQGAATISLKMSAITGSGRRVILDMAEVEYLSSMGIRSLVMGAKAAASRGGGMVLLAPSPEVLAVLTNTGIQQIIPVCHDLDEAMRLVTA